MGRLPQSPFEVRLAVTLFLGLLGIADFFGAWQVQQLRRVHAARRGRHRGARKSITRWRWSAAA